MKEITEIIAPEANYLLHEDPDAQDGFTDFGWRCREHVVVLMSYFKHKKIKYNIIFGDVVLYHKESNRGLSTVMSSVDKHFWCSTKKYPLIDISPTFSRHTEKEVNLPPILRTGKVGDFKASYVKSAFDCMNKRDESFIAYSTITKNEPMEVEDEPRLLADSVSRHIIDLLTGRSESFIGKPREESRRIILQRYAS